MKARGSATDCIETDRNSSAGNGGDGNASGCRQKTDGNAPQRDNSK
jgi:hypothetical protein